MVVLVTGAAGFIGSNFVRLLRKERPEWKIVILDSLTYAGSRSTMADFATETTFVEGQIQDTGAVESAIRSNSVTHIVNFAAESHNDRSILNAAEFIQTNVVGTYTLLEATRKLDLSKMVHVSTDEVYGSISEGEFTESSPIQPNTPYSASKAGGDLQCRAHFISFRTPVTVTRGGNTFGPYQFPEKLIPFFVTRLIDHKKVPLYGSGAQIREWIHVEDHCRGILKVLEDGELGEVYNIGDANERSNIWMTNVMLDELGLSDVLIKFIPDPRKGAHDTRYSMNCHKLNALGWKPQKDFESSLRATVQWFVRNQDWWRPIAAKPDYQAFVARFYGPGLGEDL